MKTAIITGADGTMGQELVKNLAIEGYYIIMACHHIEKGERICQQLRIELQWKQIQAFELDLSSLENVCTFCTKIQNTIDHIDILLNNAGVLPSQAKISSNGYELTSAVNFLGHFLLTEKLFPLYIEGTKIVNMVSLTYQFGNINKDILSPISKKYNRFVCYSDSKLAVYYATLYWAEKWKNNHIFVNCTDPGIVNTNIIRMDNKIIDCLCDIFFRPIIRSPRKGADSMIFLATNTIGEQHSGQLFKNRKIVNVKSKIKNNPLQKKLINNALDIVRHYL